MKNINWQKELKDAWEVALLKKSAINHVGQEKFKTTFAYYIIIIGSILGLIGSQMYPMYFQPSFMTGLYMAIIRIVMAIVGIYIVSYIAKSFFGGHGKHDEFFRVAAYGMIVMWMGLIPHLAVISGIWGLVIIFVILKTVHKLSTGSTIGTLAVAVIISMIIFGILSPLYKRSGLSPDYMNMNSKNFKMNSGNGAVEMKGNKMKITTKDGEIEYTIPNIK